jgi:hypothetical protein
MPKPYDQYYEIHEAVRRAVRQGLIIRLTECEDCGTTASLDGHHHNGYDDAHVLDVRWLCKACHASAHPRNNDEGGRNRWANMSFDERSDYIRTQWKNLTDAQRQQHADGISAYRAGLTAEEEYEKHVAPALAGQREKYTTDRRAEATRKGWETRRRNALR